MNKSKESLLNFFHDLRTPLSVIRMKLDLFELSEEYKTSGPKTLDLVEIISKQITILTKQISEFSKETKD